MRKTLSIALVLLAAFAIAAAALAGDGKPPGGQDTSSTATLASFADCLRSHGLTPPETTDGVALKSWLRTQYDSNPAAKAAIEACAPPAGKKPGPGAAGPSEAQLVACLRQHGLAVPSGTPLDAWIQSQDPAVVKPVIAACATDQKAGPPKQPRA